MKTTEVNDLKVLIVDSNVFIAKTLHSMLDAFGVEKIIMCHSLEDAEKKYFSTDLGCIFIDFMMENRTGINFIKKIRAKPSSKNKPDMPIILNTGVTDIDTIVMARDAGVTEVIGKPFSPEQVLQKLNNAIKNRRAFIDVDEYIGPNRRRRTSNIDDWSGDNDRRGD